MIVQRIGIPIYLQVKNYIMDKIKSGELKPGDKIPTERELARAFGISRNTVSAAYKELLVEEILEARQGRGTFVKGSAGVFADREDGAGGGRRERALRVIDEALNRVVAWGFSVDQFIAFATIRARQKAEDAGRLRVAVVDEAIEHARHFAAQITRAVNVKTEPVALRDLLSGAVPVDLLNACDLVVVNAEIQNRVAELLDAADKLAPVTAAPGIDAVVKLARLGAGAKVGIVAESAEFIASLRRLLTRTIIENIELEEMIATEITPELGRFVGRNAVLAVAEGCENAVRRLAGDTQNVVVFSYEMDRGSLNQLVARLLL